MGLNSKKVLVTGADGFIGSHLAEMLVSEGANVRALIQYNSFNSWGWLDHSKLSQHMEVVAGDVRDPHACSKLLQEVEIVFHLAALIAIPFSYRSPSSYIDTNVHGTLNICQAALDNNCEKVIHTSTSEVYGTALYVPIDEKHPLQAQSPYSASKIGADSMAISYHNSFNLPLVIARPFNTYGPRQSARAVIPTIITQIATGRTKIELGDLSPTRDFNYVEDTCRGFIELASGKSCIGQEVNIGSNFEISIGETMELICELMGSKVDFTESEERRRPDNSEVFRLWCDNSKIHSLTGFEPRVSIREGLQRTIDWFSDPDNLTLYKANIYNV